MEALLFVDPALPKRRGVEEAIRRAVGSGVLPVGSRLPSARELSADLGIARGTVVAAVDDLVAEGLLEARARTGIFVARSIGRPHTSPPPGASDSPWFDLRPGRPEAGSFPVSRWAAALRRAAAAPPEPDDGAGSAILRAELAAYLARARGVETSPESIVVTVGYRGGVWALALALTGLGMSNVAIEDPALPQAEAAWKAFGWEVADLPVDASGARTDLLEQSIDVAVVTPSHQFPLGGALDARRRRAAVEWASRVDGLVVEDDYDGEFRFDRRPVAALQRSEPQRIAYIGSTSKTLDTRLRLGWLVLPHELVAPTRRAVTALSGGVSALEQLALAELIRSGDFERHIRRQRREYARRRAILQRVAAEAGLTLPGIPAGLQAVIPVRPDWLERHAPSDDGTVRIDGLLTHSLERYSRFFHQDAALVAGFSTPSRAMFEPAIAALISALTK
ncbi:MAG: PLP-dependent aminotransferase family protein [Leifsonia sp.]